MVEVGREILNAVKIGLIDVDGHNYPNLPLMKISAWHKSMGDSVEWYQPLFSSHMDRVYMSKVFSFSEDYPYYIDADEVYRGGTGYAIKTVDGVEKYHAELDDKLPEEVEHIYPDYSLYSEMTEDTAYGFLTRGCPRGCSFCHVADKEGKCSVKVADLSEFWRGQKNIVLCDPNLIACREWEDLLGQLIESKAWIDINQGVDIRIMTEAKADMIRQLKIKNIHFAWDRYEDRDIIVPKLKMFAETTGWDFRKMTVFVLTNYDTTFEQDLERIYTLRDLGYTPYVMIYNRQSTTMEDNCRKLQRWCNNRRLYRACERFEDYDARGKQRKYLKR